MMQSQVQHYGETEAVEAAQAFMQQTCSEMSALSGTTSLVTSPYDEYKGISSTALTHQTGPDYLACWYNTHSHW